MRCCGKEISQGSGPPKTSTDRWIGVNDYYHLLSEAAKELNPRLFREGRDNLAKTNQNDEGGGLARRLSNQRGHLKGLWENSRTGQTVTGVAEHALHEEARVVGAAAAAAAVFAGVGAQQTVTAGTLKGWGGHVRRQTVPARLGQRRGGTLEEGRIKT